MTIDQKLHAVQIGGAPLVKRSPLFSQDGNFLFTPNGQEIKVFSTNTAECVQRLVGDKGNVRGIAHHPNNKLQLISCTDRGWLTVWDFEDGIALKTHKVCDYIVGIFSDSNIKDYVFMMEKDGDARAVMLVPLSIFSNAGNREIEKIDTDVNGRLPVGFLRSGDCMVCFKERKVSVVHWRKKTVRVEHDVKKGGFVKCFACHPSEDCIVMGQTSGLIKVWHDVCPGLDGSMKNPIISTFHWHSSAVTGIAFTPGGSSFLSVGAESVLVQWYYKGSVTKKSVLPGLGAACRYIVTSADGNLYATTHEDNSISIITNFFSVKHTLRGLTLMSKQLHQSEIFQYNSRTRSLITFGKPGHVVFFDPTKDEELYSLDITHENYIATPGFDRLPQTAITCLAVQNDNKNCPSYWMATSEILDIDQSLREIRLKFWLFSEKFKWWTLNTVINEPHKTSLNEMCFRPSFVETQSSLVSAGTDGMVKLWAVNIKSGSRPFWSCVATASYRGQKACRCAFSQDGSVLAVAFDHTVCLLDPETLDISSVFLSHEKKEVVNKLAFGRHSCQHMLVVVFESQMQAHNLINGNLSWFVNTKVSNIVCDPLSEYMAVVTADDNDLYVIKPTSASPVHVQKKFIDRKVSSLAFLPVQDCNFTWLDQSSKTTWMLLSRLCISSDDASIFTLCTEAEMKSVAQSAIRRSASSHGPLKTPMAHILHEKKPRNTKHVAKENIVHVTNRSCLSAMKLITDSSPHVLPSLADHCKEFLTSLLRSKKNESLNVPEVETPVTDDMLDDRIDNHLGVQSGLITGVINLNIQSKGNFKFLEDL